MMVFLVIHLWLCLFLTTLAIIRNVRGVVFWFDVLWCLAAPVVVPLSFFDSLFIWLKLKR